MPPPRPNPEASDPAAPSPAPSDISPLDATVRAAQPSPAADAAALCATVASDARAPRLPRGTAVGRYLIIGQIGEGAMAAVFSAYDPDLDRKVALKLLKLDGSDDGEQRRARLLHEAKAVARLSHPNVVAVYDAGSFDQQVFMAMELVEGLTLRDWLDARPRGRAEILRAFVAAGAGLAAAHAAGMVHRDFKPENVLVGADGRVRVSDFGLARVETSTETEAGAVVGTPAYMAPEQLESRAVDARTDQFAFCVALWEALCGERPFAGDDFWAIRRHVLAGTVRPPPRERPLPGWLKSVLLRGLAVRPEDRFASLEQLLSALRRDRRRRRLLRLRTAAAALVLVGGLAAAGTSYYREQTRCSREAEELAAPILGDTPRSQVLAALEGAGLPAKLAEQVRAAFVGFSDGWTRAWREQCELGRTDARRAAPAASCLERAAQRGRASWAALTSRQAGPTFATRLVSKLPASGECLRVLAARPGGALDPRWARLEETRVLLTLGRHAQAEQQLEALLAAAEPEAHAVRAEILQQLSEAIWEGRAQAEPAVARLREAAREADAGGDDRASFDARVGLADLLSEGLDRREEAEQVGLEAEAWLSRLGRPASSERLLVNARANLASRLGRGQESLALYRRSIELCEQMGPTCSTRLASSYLNLASQQYEMGFFSESNAGNRRALGLLEDLGLHAQLDPVVAWGNLALGELGLGRGEAALAACQRAGALLDELAESDAAGYRSWADLITAQALETLGRRDEARALYDRVVAVGDTLDALSLSDALAGKARVELAAGKHEAALADAEEALRLTTTRPWGKETAFGARFALARALRAAGKDPARARALAQEALSRLQGKEDGFSRAQVEAFLAEDGSAPSAAAQ